MSRTAALAGLCLALCLATAAGKGVRAFVERLPVSPRSAVCLSGRRPCWRLFRGHASRTWGTGCGTSPTSWEQRAARRACKTSGIVQSRMMGTPRVRCAPSLCSDKARFAAVRARRRACGPCAWRRCWGDPHPPRERSGRSGVYVRRAYSDGYATHAVGAVPIESRRSES